MIIRGMALLAVLHIRGTQAARTVDPNWGRNTLWSWESKFTEEQGDGWIEITLTIRML
jgi:hypothetical protein